MTENKRWEKVKNCKHSTIASMNVCRCANCNLTFATIRKKYIEKIKGLEKDLRIANQIIKNYEEK